MARNPGGDGRDLLAYVPAIQAAWLASGDDALWRAVEGTLVFADISGFTPLTERLAARGKVGAEELTDILNEVFGALLGVAEGFGGDLLKFGGDALLLLFTGPQHPARAAAAAAGMQSAVRPYRRLRTSGGVVSLRMSVGVNTGTFQLFLVGGSHRELLVTGPDSSRTAELEAAADPGEVLLGASTAGTLDGRHHGASRGDGVVMRGTPEVARRPLMRGRPDARTDLAVPVGLRDHLRASRDGGEHRVVVVSFIQFTGSDDLIATDGPDVVARELDALVRGAQDACEAHGVTFLATDVDRNGGKILLAAGAPTSSTDDADRMLHALRAIVTPERRLRVRAGVNRGRAFAGDVGSPARRTYAVMGDPTNLAARVMGKAEARAVLATDTVTVALRDRFLLVTVPPFLVKGKTAPVSAHVVGDPLGRAATGRELPLTGRADELAALRAAYHQSRSAGARSVVVTGEPGIGKSRLVDEFLVALPNETIVRAEGAAYATHSPYLALRRPLRRLVGAAPDASDVEVTERLWALTADAAPGLIPMLPLLAIPFGIELPDTPETADVASAFRRTRLQTAVVQLLGAVLPDFGVLVVEDVQWLDPASGALLDELLATWGDAGWLAVYTRRPGAPDPPPGERERTTIALGPLPHATCVGLVHTVTEARPLPDHVVDALAERSGGNPMFLSELVTSVLGTASTTDLPDNIEALIAGRIDALLPDERSTLRRAAVLGNRFTATLLVNLVLAEGASSVDPRATVERLDEFFASDGAGQLRFRQTLVREVAYEGLPFRLRRRLHEQAGELLEATVADTEEFSDLLSLHFLRAQRFDKAWAYARTAGHRARKNAAPLEATELFRRALDAGRGMAGVAADELVQVQVDLAEVAELAGDYDTADSALRAARRLTPPGSARLTDLYRRSGWLRERAGRYEDALRWYTRGLRAAEGEPGALQARAELTMAYGAARVRQGRYAASVSILDEAVALALAADDKATLAHAYYLLDWAHTDLGSPDAERYRTLALPIYEELGDWVGQANVLNNLGVDAYFEGRWAVAIELYDRSRHARGRAGDMVQFVTASNNIGEILSDQGHVSDAEPLFQDALRTWRAARFPVGVGIALSNLGRAASRSGRGAEAQVLLRDATEVLLGIGSEALALEAQAREAERLIFVGDGSAAGELASSLAGAVTDQPVLLAMVERLAGYGAAQTGDLDACRSHLDASLRIGSDSSAAFEVALTCEAIARVGLLAGWPDAAEASARAATGFGQLGVSTTPEVPLQAVHRTET